MNTLFELRTEKEIRAEAVSDNERRIHEAICGGGPFELNERARKILECLRGRQGRNLAISISELELKTGVSPREIKSVVSELVVVFGLPIVASRETDGGYYFATTARERIDGTANLVKEIVALAKRVSVIRQSADLNRLFGQISLELEKESA